ncbi:MAG: AMP-binding protein [Chloroflexi bacterium]|nr:AMP-binding protein [Chloroflexota bacterium]
MEKRYNIPEIETMTREDLLKYQWRLLKEQLDYTYARSGLCQRQFKAAKITPDDIKTMDDFIHKVPFNTKEDMVADQAEQPPYGTRLAVREDEIFLTYLTSGTSGKGQEVHTMTEADLERYAGVAVDTLYVWSGWKRGDKVMNPLPLGITIAAPAHYLGLMKLGCDVFNLGMYDTKTKLEYMRRFKLSGIFSTPAYLDTLTAEAEEIGINPAKDLWVRKILTAIQAYPISFVHRIEEKWNAKLFDYYGSTQWAAGGTCEKGAAQGEQRGYYHLLQHLSLHEVINPETLEPVGSGEVGELVVTPLNKKASPFLRFRSADRVRWFPYGTCDCGRPFDMLECGTITRYDDMMKIKGVNVWPEMIDEAVFTKEGTSEYQGRLYMSEDRRETAEVRIEFKKGLSEETKKALLKTISNELRDVTGIGFDVKESPEPLPHAVFKVRRWSDERVKGLEKKAIPKSG